MPVIVDGKAVAIWRREKGGRSEKGVIDVRNDCGHWPGERVHSLTR
jgi:hypothetical protein